MQGASPAAADGPAPPDAARLLAALEAPPPFPEDNIFPIEWRVETPKLVEIYEQSRDPGWSPAALPWDTLRPEDFAPDRRYRHRLLVRAARRVRQFRAGGVRQGDDPHLREARGGPGPQVLLLHRPRRGEPRGSVPAGHRAAHAGRAVRPRAGDRARPARAQQRALVPPQRRAVLGGLQARRSEIPAGDPVHRLPDGRAGGGDAVPRHAPAVDDSGVEGGVPLHRQGRGAPSRRLHGGAAQPAADAGRGTTRLRSRARSAPATSSCPASSTSRRRNSGTCRKASSPPTACSRRRRRARGWGFSTWRSAARTGARRCCG